MNAPRVSFVLIAALVSLPSLTRAQSTPAPAPVSDANRIAAREAFERGVALIEQERWADAITELQRARELRVTPAVLYNLGLAMRAVGRNREAMAAFREFTSMATSANGATPQLIARVDAYIRELSAGLARIDLQIEPPTASTRIDGTVVVASRPIEVDPGRHVVQVEADGYATETRTLEVQRGTQSTVVLRLVPTLLSSRLMVVAEPSNALVRLDGNDVGFGTVEETVRPGAHSIEVSAEGYATFRRQYDAVAGQNQTVRATLSNRRTVFESPWFWLSVGVVAVGAGVAGYFLLRDVEPPYRGTLGTVTDALTLGRF
jgi:hypothetical protein